ncbi:MAG: alanine--tRNA ligase [Clostridia bacterium]|nr:alanine--tRNA ligase [Clostridia bacterium]
MHSMGLNELREKYLAFFESKEHLRLKSFSLIPQNEKSLLLINAGMAPLKPYFTGEIVPPRKRITTCQKCIRTLDIENVGKTARHGTFFEMLGNFSFGDYFKEEAIPWAWEFLTKVLEIPEDRLYVTIYEEDDEAEQIWLKNGVPIERIFRMGKEDNFWEIGAGPCGPDSEIHFDRGPEYGCGKPGCTVGCSCDRFIEIWNLVFTQFNNDGNGNYTVLPKKNIDTGMGLERLACVMQNVGNLFEVDTIRNIMKHISEIAGKEYHANEKDDISLRVITDHIRSTTMMVSDGVLPSNEGRGYVLRRLLRRAARHGRLLGITKPFLCDVCRTVITESCEAYPELKEKEDYIVKVISMEEDRFAATLDAGLGILNDMTAALKAEGRNELSGDDAFKLYDTFGFPIDLTLELLEEQGLTLDREGFDANMNAQRERARTARAAAGDFGWAGSELAGIEDVTVFEGYSENSLNATITHIFADGEERGSITAGDSAVMLLDRTPFYAESGGQVCDLGVITSDKGVFEITDVKKTADGKFLHCGRVVSGDFAQGNTVSAKIDTDRRAAVARAHSATHLLQKALRETLGSHVEQAGSLVEPDKLRFDFTHFSAMTSEELAAVEATVNEKILASLPVTVTEMSLEDAKKTGAMALFGEKYGDTVRVVRMGDFSTELCGGTHLKNTSGAGLFKLVSESSVAAGVRRIEAVTADGVLELLESDRSLINQTCEALRSTPTELVKSALKLSNELRELRRENEKLKAAAAASKVTDALANATDLGGVKLAVITYEDAEADLLRKVGDDLKSRDEALAALLVSTAGGKLTFVSVCTKAANAAGLHAGNLVREVAKATGGNGGGRPDSASAGGKDVSLLPAALSELPKIASSMLK